MKKRRDKVIKIQPEYHLIEAENAGKTPANAAPGTKVYEVIKKLRVYLVKE